MTPTTEILGAEAARLRRAAESLADTGAQLAGHDPGPVAFGADAAGRLGALGGRLHAHLQACLEVRAREAAAHAARLRAIAEAAGQAAGGYRDTDDSASRRATGVQ